MSADGSIFVVVTKYAGRVRVYKFDPSTNLYSKLGSDFICKKNRLSVSVSADGSTFAVGVLFGANYAGLVRAYKFATSSNDYF